MQLERKAKSREQETPKQPRCCRLRCRQRTRLPALVLSLLIMMFVSTNTATVWGFSVVQSPTTSSSTTGTLLSAAVSLDETTTSSSSSTSSSLLPPRQSSSSPRWQQSRRASYNNSTTSTTLSSSTSYTPIPSSIPKLSELLKGNIKPITTTTTTTTTTTQQNGKSIISSKRTQQQTNKTTKFHNGSINKAKQKKKIVTKTASVEQQQQQKEQLPWKADYYTSFQSQSKIKRSNQNPLQTLLSLPPTACNGANICCALTLSSSSQQQSSAPPFHDFHRVVQIVQQLLQEQYHHHQHPSQQYFTLRQLSNLAWAFAKHYDRNHDELLLLLLPNDNDDDDTSPAVVFSATIDLLADTLAQAINSTSTRMATPTTKQQQIKEQELCMTSWAYGILRRRRRPPGWEQGPVVGQVVEKKDNGRDDDDDDDGSNIIQFTQVNDWNPNSSSSSNSRSTTTTKSPSSSSPTSTLDTPTGRLLDAIGHAFCWRPENNSSNIDSSSDDDDYYYYPRIRKCQWRELANVIWAFASHGRAGGSTITVELAAAIADEATRRLKQQHCDSTTTTTITNDDNYLSRDVAQIIWSLGVLQADDYRIADPLVRFVEAFAATTTSFASWSCADIVQVALSLAHARLDETELMIALYTEASRRLQNQQNYDDTMQTVSFGAAYESSQRKVFHAWELSILLWAQARLYLTKEQHGVFAIFQERSLMQLKRALDGGATLASLGVGLQEQANIAWSIAVLHDDDTDTDITSKDNAASATVSTILQAIFEEAALSCQSQGIIQLEHAHQLWQALVLLEPSCPQCFETTPDWFRNYLEEQWKAERARPKTGSARHRALSKTLNLMGVAHYEEHNEGNDVAIVLEDGANWTHETVKSQVQQGTRVAIAFDAPVHFTRQKYPPVIGSDGKPIPPRALGPTVLKYRLLKRQGWSVVRVPYYEFEKIPFWASMERQRYLQRLLKIPGTLKFSDTDRSTVSTDTPEVANKISRFD